jgi:hypothetical protein
MKKKISFGAIMCALFALGLVALNGCGKDSATGATFTLKSSNSAS